MTPTSGELHVQRLSYIRRALDELNAMFVSGDITAMSADDIRRILKARAHLMALRYHGARSGGNPNRQHGD